VHIGPFHCSSAAPGSEANIAITLTTGSMSNCRNIAITLIDSVLVQIAGFDRNLIPRSRAGEFSVGVIACFHQLSWHMRSTSVLVCALALGITCAALAQEPKREPTPPTKQEVPKRVRVSEGVMRTLILKKVQPKLSGRSAQEAAHVFFAFCLKTYSSG
jgi:hypothetical protein